VKTIAAITLAVFLSFALIMGCASNAQENGQKAGNNVTITNGGNTMANNTTARVAKNGDTVSVDYIGKFENGTLFDTSVKSEAQKAGLPLRPSYSPLEFKVGAGQMIAGFDEAVVGMKEGEEKNVTLPPEKAYGQRRDDAIISIPLEKIGNSSAIKVGSHLYAQNGASGVVTEIKGGNATVDFNSEMAGKTLVFTIRMVKIK
jgi:FKBP-type peptidyl-prolyl cis-trans isomerase 2